MRSSVRERNDTELIRRGFALSWQHLAHASYPHDSELQNARSPVPGACTRSKSNLAAAPCSSCCPILWAGASPAVFKKPREGNAEDMKVVLWFNNFHEHRNAFLRLGLMRLHREHQLSYTELPLAACVDYGFSADSRQTKHRHTSVILSEVTDRYRYVSRRQRGLFFICRHLSQRSIPISVRVITRGFFVERNFSPPYPWQHQGKWNSMSSGRAN